MTHFVASFIGGAITCSISVLIASRCFYNLGKKHGAQREREAILNLIEKMEGEKNSIQN